MKFAPFDYVKPADLAAAIGCLEGNDDAKILAGGQSLLPLMALRLARPTLLVDIGCLSLDGISTESAGGDAFLRLGALVRHERLLRDPFVKVNAPLLAEAAAYVGHPAIRTLGSLGGSIAHADPAAELPAALVALGGSVEAVGPSGQRVVPCESLFEGFFTTGLESSEVITAIRIPISPVPESASWCEWAPRHGDFAEVGIGVSLTFSEDGRCTTVKAAACGVGATPVGLTDTLAPVLVGRWGDDPEALRETARVVAGVLAHPDKSDLGGLLCARAVKRAYESRSVGAPGPGS
ncbi:MAG TPA: FAD binding domain-containing protein [Acidimicrobiales bacterium]